jgi:hypothetical protein
VWHRPRAGGRSFRAALLRAEGPGPMKDPRSGPDQTGPDQTGPDQTGRIRPGRTGPDRRGASGVAVTRVVVPAATGIRDAHDVPGDQAEGCRLTVSAGVSPPGPPPHGCVGCPR